MGSELLIHHLLKCVEGMWPSHKSTADAAENLELARNMAVIVKYRYTTADRHRRNGIHTQYKVMLISQGYNGSIGVIFEKLYGYDAEATFDGFAQRVDDILDAIMRGALEAHRSIRDMDGDYRNRTPTKISIFDWLL